MRNKYSTPKNDVLVGATFTIRQLRNAYSESGGPLSIRHRRFLRTFIPPYINGSGLDTEFAILIPLSKVLEKAPRNVLQRLRNHFERVDEEWLKNRPWIGQEENKINPTLIDQELGTELDEGWNAKWEIENG
jgi:hypothetical protein